MECKSREDVIIKFQARITYYKYVEEIECLRAFFLNAHLLFYFFYIVI